MLGFHLGNEWRQLWSSSRSRTALVLFLILAVWALYGGLRWQSLSTSALASTPADLLTEREEWLDELEKFEAGEEISPYAARPMSLSYLAIHKPAPLSALAFRGEAIHPHGAIVSGWRSEASLFQRYEVQGPAPLKVGTLDLAFVATVLLPLFLLVLSFDVLSREREAGRLRLFLAQGGEAAQLVLARILVVSSPLLIIVAGCVLVAALLNGGSLAAIALWHLAVIAYVLLWAGIAFCIAVSFATRAGGALAVLAAWALLVVLLPSASQFVAQAVQPLPSKVSYLSEARDAEGQTRRNLAQRAEVYMAEHPGQSADSDDAVPGYYRSAYLANVDINQRTRPILQQLEARQASQRAIVSAASFLAPSLAIQSAFEAASNTGLGNAAAFRKQARAFLEKLLDKIGPATVAKSRLTTAQVQAIPEFAFVKPAVPAAVLLGVAWAAILGLVLALIGWRRANNVV